ncbi:sugar ABC transporter substrate-binding protein [Verminephrobacter aporrectodeae subsp. tuberculatae]|uniref:substrate-binding domain-containing protein n=1 Tax=Verminephrobacter aporrectodeae TaxID=1110389 RepID=UPI002237ACD1|nr:substrate-binding domain-containing protein [Verminephrobacter aporrectodeae]MCW5257664.1 sugar ABC transporter substrate-binding protein [Verminephrobacter aporrectodeae subsp. tuberculatae]MCW8199713.1 sugar ABC transporter substrate-binding protein [Verminephrobacter aporrectodeae subsp. tuberculatae]MCW8208876.1 sugar ABC transporter substrate-binding protein [Verminephrobacter aporrectodeae subsp. tuberculatae]
MRRNFLKTVALASTGLAATPAAFAQTAATAGLRGNASDVYVMNVMVSGVEYWFPVYEMMKQLGRTLGVKTRYTGTPEYDVNKQLASFEQELARKPTGILLHPMNPDPFIEPINRAAAMGIPVVTFAADSPNSKRVSFVTSDNEREGSQAADAIAASLNARGEYGVLENPGQDNHDRRIAAFINRMKTRHPGMKLVGRAASNQDPNKAYQATLSMAQANPDLGALFMPEANSALGAAQAKVETKKNIQVMCCDVNAKILDMIKSGEVFGSINPNQGVQGYMGMLMLFLAKNAQLIDPMNDAKRNGANPMAVPFLDNGLSVVSKANADDFYWDKYLTRRGTKGINE